MKLTKTQCDKFKPIGRPYKRFDGGGLYLEVTSKGKKLWRLKYYYQGKEKRLSLGTYPAVTLVRARVKRQALRSLLDQGLDPSKERVAQKRLSMRQSGTTLESVALEWHEQQLERWGHRRGIIVMQRLKKNIFPYLGNTPIHSIKPLDLLDVLKLIEQRGAFEVSRRVNNICSQIFEYSIIKGLCEHNPARNLSKALKKRKTTHFASIEAREIPELLAALNKNEARLYRQTRNAILFSMLTFVRPKEVRHARWQDIDLEAGVWRIPAEFMKTGSLHIVPLAKQTIALLRKQKEETEDLSAIWVFPGQFNIEKPMSEGTVNKALKLLGFDGRMTAHGFRALARTAIREELDYLPDIIEAQLAHKSSGALGAAYDRAQFLKQRKVMMQEWSNYIDGFAKS